MSGVEWFPGVVKKRGVFGVPGGIVLRAPEGPLFGVLAGLGVPKGCFWGPTFVV